MPSWDVAQWLEQVAWLRPDLLLRLILAAVLGGVVGLEREVSGKPAGFRTNLLICVGAALLTDLSVSISRLADPLQTAADPARIAAQIVSGIGFLGAGTIIQSRGSVVGLTTAATLWVVSAIGIGVGAGAYVEAVGTTLLVIIALIVLGRVEARLLAEPGERTVHVTLNPDPELAWRVEQELEQAGYRVALLEVEKRPDAYLVLLRAEDRAIRTGDITRRLIGLSGVRKVTQA